MAIYNKRTGAMQVRVRGVSDLVRDMVREDESLRKYAKKGVLEAGQYLMEVMKEKMGVYQPTGGRGGGSWERLKPETVFRKARKFGRSVANKPLIASGQMKNSFSVYGSRSSKAISATVTNTDPKMVHHVFGAPRKGIPPRDVMLITAVEEADICHDIIMDSVLEGMNK